LKRTTMTTLTQAAQHICAEWQAAWNAHDMARIAPLITPDADWITVGGKHLQGAEQIESIHRTLHASTLSNSIWTNRSIDVKPLGADTALLHLAWSVSGDTDADGSPRPPRNGLFTWVLVLNGTEWQIRAAQGTNVVR
jgi:uncharacterized protein (TIGR02246 family)